MPTQTQPVRHVVVGSVAANVRAEMARTRTTQATAAHALGITQQSVSARLHGRVDFTASELVALARLLNVEPGSLLRGAL